MISFNIKKEDILLTLVTTVGNFQSQAIQEKLKELQKLNIKRLALFPTCFERKERVLLYRILEELKVKEIPFVHLRNDMNKDELIFLKKKFKTQVFNIHPLQQYPLLFDLSSFKNKIFVENNYSFRTEDLEKFGGICLDFSHLENDRLLNNSNYQTVRDSLKKYSVGCNHISAIEKEPHSASTLVNGKMETRLCYAKHFFTDLSQFNYLKNYPNNYFSHFIALELENSFKEQDRARDYIFSLLQNVSNAS